VSAGRFPYVHWHHGAKLLISYDFYPCPVGTELSYEMSLTSYGGVKDVNQSVPLQLGFERFQCINLNKI